MNLTLRLIFIGRVIAVGTPIAVAVSTKDQYMEFLDEERIRANDDIVLNEVHNFIESSEIKPDQKVLLRFVRNLISAGSLPGPDDGQYESARLIRCLMN
jgi:hypothetical protein